MRTAPRFRVEALDLFERDVRLRMPFRFGMVTLTAAPQAFARARIRLGDGHCAEGAAAEMLAPKWFDKNPALSNQDNFDQLRLSLALARESYLEGDARTAFAHFASRYDLQRGRCADRGLNPLIAGYGPALIDRAILDALCRALGSPFHEAIRTDRAGIAEPASGLLDLCPDLHDFDVSAFLRSLRPADRIAARHTVGLVDPIGAADRSTRVDDGLPETLAEVIAAYGHRWFKLKVGGDVPADVERLAAIAATLDTIPGDYHATIDGNEQYADIGGALELWHRMRADPRLARLCASIVFIEQPIARQQALCGDVRALSSLAPVIIDESDDALDAFVRARELGYTGVSSKTCKGLYKSLINAARCEKWNRGAGAGSRPRHFMSAEDLTIQPGIALQQDLALVSLLGIGHVERNGHHYVNGMAGVAQDEQDAFFAAHPDLYERSHGAVRARIRGGEMAIASLRCPGFASAAMPDWTALRPMQAAPPERPPHAVRVC